MDVLLECPLDGRLKHMKAENFIKQILVGSLHASYMAVGEDFRFGYERKGTPDLLEKNGEKYGFVTEVLSKEMDGDRKISSTYIREELNRGNMEKTAGLLGCDFYVSGTVEHGRGMGHRTFFPYGEYHSAAGETDASQRSLHYRVKFWRGSISGNYQCGI